MSLTHLDADLLQKVADAGRHSAEQALIHIAGEIQGLVPELMDTLTPEGPYAYTVIPEVRPDGSVKLPVLTTREEIHEVYELITGMRELLSVSALTEVRGEWYTFQDSISRTRRKPTGELGSGHTIALFPSGKGTGITGELVWLRKPREQLGTPGATGSGVTEEMLVREEVFQLHQQYMNALRRGDVDGVLEVLNDGIASAIRDYVNETGTLMMLEGKAAHRDYYEAFFAKYEMISVEPFDRIAETWYVFAELRFTVRLRSTGEIRTFNTAEFHVPANDGRFIARVGHGTALVAD
jgi:hypothetical protein